MRLERGCDAPSPSLLLPFAPDVRRCPRAIVGPLAHQWVELYARWRTLEELPFPGGWGDQPAVVGDAFFQIAGALAASARERAEEELSRWPTSPTA